MRRVFAVGILTLLGGCAAVNTAGLRQGYAKYLERPGGKAMVSGDEDRKVYSFWGQESDDAALTKADARCKNGGNPACTVLFLGAVQKGYVTLERAVSIPDTYVRNVSDIQWPEKPRDDSPGFAAALLAGLSGGVNDYARLRAGAGSAKAANFVQYMDTVNAATGQTPVKTNHASANAATSAGKNVQPAPAVAGGSLAVPAYARVSGQCHKDLGYLGSRFPVFSDLTLVAMKQDVVTTDIFGGMVSVNEAGKSPSDGVTLALAQASEFERSGREAFQSASAVDALGLSDEQFMDQLKANRLNPSDCSSGIRNPALCAGITYRMQAIKYRALAGEFECHRTAGTWPR